MNDTEKLERIAQLLEEVRDNQKAQLERQAESLSLQEEQFQIFLKQHEKTAQIQDRAEAIQEKSSQLINRVRRFVPLAMVVIVVIIIYLTWLLLRYSR
ncbi:MAG: hypothetical protein LAO07_12975 [Acidobacteriia bacterium]|nr:hypothetical protein [Terriglobia bacterium]